MILINSSLSRLLMFLMSFYSLHEMLHQEIAKYESRFFWAGEGDKQKYYMVISLDIWKPRDQGGLEIMSSRSMNTTLPTRWLWRIANGESGLWLDIIGNKYLRGQPLAFCQRTSGSQFWQAIIQLLPILQIGTSISVGCGSSTLFSFDLWVGDRPLVARFPELFSIAVDPVSVEAALIDIGRLMSVGPSALVRYSFWHWIRGRLPSRVEVLKRNDTGDGLCSLCSMVEDANQIFFSRVVAQFVWTCFRKVSPQDRDAIGTFLADLRAMAFRSLKFEEKMVA
ncbi:ABC transporter G family member 37 [Hordeum vulgare]|nr:ABC transporter G family member 37 [Hordeum vulgare]